MQITLKRNVVTSEATLGALFVDGVFFCYTLEDLPRENKVAGQTCIPSGTYQILKRKVLSDKTKKYRTKFAWFDWHLELQNVPDFKYVYIHIGNTHKDTDGCLLVGSSISESDSFIENSTKTFEKLYKKISEELTAGIDVLITIEN